MKQITVSGYVTVPYVINIEVDDLVTLNTDDDYAMLNLEERLSKELHLSNMVDHILDVKIIDIDDK